MAVSASKKKKKKKMKLIGEFLSGLFLKTFDVLA